MTVDGQVTQLNGEEINGVLGKWEFAICDSKKDDVIKISIFDSDFQNVVFEKEYFSSLSLKDISLDLRKELAGEMKKALSNDNLNLESPKILDLLYKIDNLDPKFGNELANKMDDITASVKKIDKNSE